MSDLRGYLRLEHMPHIWCAGCGAGIVMRALLGAIDRLGWSKNDTVIVGGIGCSSRLPGYVDFHTLHTTHGRALAFATGVKMARPELHVVVVTGDGDGTAIGGNHFIHAARRNLDVTVVLFNNWIYGMTGGQVSPTTPLGHFASTAPFGALEPAFDIAELARAAGATYVARETAFHARRLERFIGEGLRKPGFAIVEALAPCPTGYGRRNRAGSAVTMLEWLRDNTLTLKQAERLTPEERGDKILTGVFVDRERPEFSAQYRALSERLRAQDAGLNA